MKYVADWDSVKSRYIECWAKENHDRPLLNIVAPKKTAINVNWPAKPSTVKDKWTDVEYVIKYNRAIFESTAYVAEGFPNMYPNLGPDLFAAFLGCELEYGEDTSWASHFVKDWKQFDLFTLDLNNKYWRLITEITRAIVEDAKGDYFVGITDLHPGMDALAALRGPENLCFDLIDCHEDILHVPMKFFDVLKDVYDRLYDITSKNMSGSSNWMTPWHPGKWYVTSCDFICMISPEAFEAFVVPELIAEAKWFDANIFHLDGPGALRHLDRLLEIPEIDGIQWVPGAGAKPMSEWGPVLRKIQKAGKILQISTTADDIRKLPEIIGPEGVMISCWASSQDEAEEIVKFSEKEFYKNRFYKL